MNNSIIAVYSDTLKSRNQDKCKTFCNDKSGIRGVIIADGIGSHEKAEVGAEFVVNRLSELLISAGNPDEQDFEYLFKQLKADFIAYIENHDEFKHIDPKGAFGTTVICAISTHEEYIIAYAGNGSAWHIMGEMNHFPGHYYMPWNMINHLAPHSVPEGGKPALYNYLSAQRDIAFFPSVVTIKKQKRIKPQGIIVTTDGIYSSDGDVCGMDANNEVWMPVNKSFIQVLNGLKDLVKRDNKELTPELLEEKATEWVQWMKNNQMMHDDTTIGLMVDL